MKNKIDYLRYNTIEEQLTECLAQFEKIVQEKSEALAHAPDGRIRTSLTRKGLCRYYLCGSAGKNGETYIPKKESDLICALLQKKYDEAVLKYAVKETKLIRGFLKRACPLQLPAMPRYEQDKYPIERYVLPEEEFVKQWEARSYEKKGFRPDYPEYYSEKGERVRSKSEVLIANLLFKLNIPYRYEAPVRLPGGVVFHPDFTLLGPETHREYLWEHLGMMDDSGYVRDAMDRIRQYEHAGYFPGNDLILSFESAQYPINMKDIEKKIRTLVR